MDLDDNDNIFLSEYISWEKKWEKYYKWVLSNYIIIDLIYSSVVQVESFAKHFLL